MDLVSRWRPAHMLLVRVGPMTALPGDEGLRASVEEQVTDRVGVLAGELGLPLAPQVEVVLVEPPGVEVGSDGQAVAASDLDLEEAWRLVAPAAERPVPFGWEWQPWAAAVRHLADAQVLVGDFVAEVVAGLVQRRPDRLLTVRQAVAFLMPHSGMDARDVDPEFLIRTAAPALGHGIGIGDRERVLDHLANTHQSERERVEMLVADLRADSVDVLVGPDLADELAGPSVDDRFHLLGDELLEELGVRIPDVRLVAGNGLAAGRLAVRINALTGRPHPCLPPGTMMVDAAPDELGDRFGRPAPVRDPASGARCSIVDARHAAALRAAGRLTWTPVDHLVRSVAAEIRRRAASLVDVRLVEYELALLHREAPDLVLEALAVTGLPELTEAARELVRDGPGIRNLRLVLERLLAVGALPDPADRALIDDGGPWAATARPGTLRPDEDRTGFVRAGMREILAHRHGAGSGRLAAVIVREDVADRVREHRAHHQAPATGRPLSQDEISHLHAVVRRAHEQGLDPRPPVLLTVGDVRGTLASLLADAVPDVAVIAFDELPWHTEVVARGHLSFAEVEAP